MAKGISNLDRKHARLKIGLPTTVIGCGSDGEWRETVKTVDISEGSIAVNLTAAVQVGDVVFIELPFPLRLKGRSRSGQVSSVYARVMRVEPDEEGKQLIGLEFLDTLPASSSDPLH